MSFRAATIFKAPLVVQLYRVAFAVCAYYFGSFVWSERHTGSFTGLLTLQGFTFFSLLGFVYTCVRARRAQWVLTVLGILIPATIFTGMCLMSFSRPEAWWDWLLSSILFGLLFSAPIVFGVKLFKDKTTSEYFKASLD